MGYGPWGHEGSDRTETSTFPFPVWRRPLGVYGGGLLQSSGMPCLTLRKEQTLGLQAVSRGQGTSRATGQAGTVAPDPGRW